MDVMLEVRDPSLGRRGQLDARDISGVTLIRRRRALGAWSLQVPDGNAVGDLLRQPGWGLIATLDNGEVFLSGPLERAEFSQDAGDNGVWTLSGYDDNRVLTDLLAWPTPSTSDLTLQTGTSSSGYDQRSGPAESVIRAYLSANAGPGAASDRRVSVLDVAADLGRGFTVNGSARFDTLSDLLDGIAKVGGNLNYRVRQNGARLLFEIQPSRDVSALIRFDVANGTAESVTYSYEAPTLTRAIVGGSGSSATRALVGRWSAASLAAETLWGRRIEQFIDRGDTSSITELNQSGDQALTDGGITKVALQITPADTPDVQYGRDYREGDTVAVSVGSTTIVDVVSEVALTYDASGLQVKATVGDPTAAFTDPLLKALAATRDQARRLGRLERR